MRPNPHCDIHVMGLGEIHVMGRRDMKPGRLHMARYSSCTENSNRRTAVHKSCIIPLDRVIRTPVLKGHLRGCVLP